MKILMLNDNYPPEMNANARIFSELAELWAKEKCTTSVITSHPNFPSGKIFNGYKNRWRTKSIIKAINVIRVKTYIHPNQGVFKRSLDFISFGVSSFFFGLLEKGNDIIIGVTPQFFSALSACFLAILKRKPFVLILCDLWPDSIVSNNCMPKGFIYKVLKKLEVFMYEKASTIAILSPCFRKYLNGLSIENRKIIDSISGPAKTFYSRKKCKTLLEKYSLHQKFIVGYVGTFGISHNHEDILSIASSLKSTDIHFLMVGDGAKKEFLNDLKIKNHLNNVTIDGPFAKNDIPNYWSLCDIAIIPLVSTKTNKTVIPSKILEAMAMGLPIILYTPKGEATRFFSDSKAIWHIETGDVNNLKKLIIQIASKKDISDKRKNAIDFSKKFTREKQALALLNNMFEIYK